MLVMGLTVNTTSDGLDLMDGNVALVNSEKGVLIAIAEERLSREKYDGGIRKAFNYCLEGSGVAATDIDAFVFSNCCDSSLEKRFVSEYLAQEQLQIPESKIICCPSHHLSHAAGVFLTSPFDESLIIITDNEGNVIGEREAGAYFENSLEKTSVYSARGTDIELIERLHHYPGDLGFGNVFAYFTEYLGFRNYQAAGKVMGLSAYGDRSHFGDVELYENKFGHRRCRIEPLYNKRLAIRRFLLNQTGRDYGYFKTGSTEHPDEIQKDLALLVQREIEKELINLVTASVKKTGIKNLCLGGGVALNCIANGKILKNSPVEQIHVCPAPGDSGQGLGNALWYINENKLLRRDLLSHFSPYQGVAYTREQLLEEVYSFESEIQIEIMQDPVKDAAEDLVSDKIVFWFQGRSEIGPRALGNRSILANPTSPGIKQVLNERVKHREGFRPFAPSVLKEDASLYFELTDSRYMHIAVAVRENMIHRIPGVVHVDGTARVQTVAQEDNPLFYSLLAAFKEKTGVPVLLNTSFNVRGEPIVERAKDAIECFLQTHGDVLYVENMRISKRP